MWHRTLKYAGIFTATGIGVTLHLNSYDLQVFGAVRTARTITNVAAIALAYKKCGKTESEWSEVHTFAAEKLLTLCETNGGVYLKVGQHIGTLNDFLPAEYVQTMRALHKVKLKVPVEEVCKLIEHDLKMKVSEKLNKITKIEVIFFSSPPKFSRPSTPNRFTLLCWHKFIAPP